MEYRISQYGRVSSAVFCSVFIAGGLFVACLPFWAITGGAAILAAVAGIAVICLSTGVWINTIQTKLSITSDTIELTRAFGYSRRMLVAEIAGWRKEKNVYTLISKSGGTSFQIPASLENYRDVKDWIKYNFSNVDAIVVEKETKEILTNEDFGFTVEEREAKLAGAKKSTRTFNIVAIIAAMAYLVFPPKYILLAVIASLLPFIALWFVWQYKGLVTVNAGRASAYPSVLAVIIVSCFAIFFKAIASYNLYDYQAIWQWLAVSTAVASAIAYTTAFSGRHNAINKRPVFCLLIVLFAGYSYGCIVYANCHFNVSQPQAYAMPVIDKHVSHGKTTSYYITTPPWGKYTHRQSFNVSHGRYQNTNINDTVYVSLQQGGLGISWYYLEE